MIMKKWFKRMYISGRRKRLLLLLFGLCLMIAALPAEVRAENNMETASAQPAAAVSAKEGLADEEREQLSSGDYETTVSGMMKRQGQEKKKPAVPAEQKAMAASAREDYPVWVADVQITSFNADNVLEGTENDGKVRYNPDTQTLTLDGANITYNSANRAAVIWTRNNATGRTDLTIELLNENKIISETTYAGNDDAKSRVIDATDDLTFIGSGSLEIVGKAVSGGPIFTICSGRALKFENTTVTAIAGDCTPGINTWDRSWAICGESVQIIGGKVTAKAGDATEAGSSTAITSAWGDIEISDNAEVIAEAGKGEGSYAISTDYALKVSDSKVSAAGGEAADSSYGIVADKIVFANSKINAGTGTAENEYSVAIWTNEMEINDSDVTAKGGTAGLESYGISAASFTLNGGYVHTEGGAAADWSIGLWTESANISAGRLAAMVGQAAGTNAITSSPSFINDYMVTVKAGASEADAEVIESPTDETYWDSIYVLIKPYHGHVWAEQWTYDEAYHWHVCTADECEITDTAKMDAYGGHIYDDEYDEECNICGAKRSVPSRPEQPSYKIIDGAGSKWILKEDGSLSIKGDGDFDKFKGVKVDGKLLEGENYNVRPGSTIVELKPAYLNTLSAGSHNLEILWTDGSAGTVFTIVADTSNTGSDDNSSSNNSSSGTADSMNTSDSSDSGSNDDGGNSDSGSNDGNGNSDGDDSSSTTNTVNNKNTVSPAVAADRGSKDAVPKTGEGESAVRAAAILAISGIGMVLTKKKQRFIGR